MKKNKKNILLFLITLILLIIMILAINKLINFNNKDNDKKTVIIQKENIEIQPKDPIILSLLDFDFYEYIDFDFLIAKVNLKSETNDFNLILQELKTSQNIQLSDYKKYNEVLEMNNYFISKAGVDFKIENKDRVVDVNLFIPLKKGTDHLFLEYKNQKIEFNNLITKKRNIDNLKDSSLNFSDNFSYRLNYIHNFDASASQMFMKNLEYNSPSSVKTYAFEFILESLNKNNIYIEQAYFIDDESKEKFTVLDKDFTNDKYLNLFNLNTTEIKKGYLFIEAYNPFEEPINYKGKLFIKLNTSDDFIEIETIINQEEV